MSFDYKSAHSLEGKKVIVTGAGGNLGAEICRGLTAMGASVLATDVAVEKGQAIVEELTAAGATAHFLEHDVTDEAQWEAAVATAIEKLGGLNGVINNAAIVPMNYLAELEVEEYNRVLNVNVTGSMLGCKHGFRAMQPGGPAGKRRLDHQYVFCYGSGRHNCLGLLQLVQRCCAPADQISRGRMRHVENRYPL